MNTLLEDLKTEVAALLGIEEASLQSPRSSRHMNVDWAMVEALGIHFYVSQPKVAQHNGRKKYTVSDSSDRTLKVLEECTTLLEAFKEYQIHQGMKKYQIHQGKKRFYLDQVDGVFESEVATSSNSSDRA
jgi:hypothetical protein